MTEDSATLKKVCAIILIGGLSVTVLLIILATFVIT